MSRSNPEKKKRRLAKKTLLLYGEGMHEKIFLEYVKGVYHTRDNNVAVTIKKGRGGSANEIVSNSLKVVGEFEKRIVVLDNDKVKKEMEKAKKIAQKNGIEILENTPCLDAELLSLLNHGEDFSKKKSDWCKKEFERRYISKKKRSEKSEYAKIFPKDLLEDQRGNISFLARVIDYMGEK